MDIFGVLAVILMAWTIFELKRKKREPVKALPEPEKPKALEYWVEDHRLVKTWRATEQENRPGIAAWAWKCSCGVKGSAGNAEQGKTLGSEENAIQRFKNHAKGYREANSGVINPISIKLKEVEAEFAEYREKCYCKHTNDDLILLDAKRKES